MLTRVRTFCRLAFSQRSSTGSHVPVETYIGETIRRLETRLKEHKDACIKQLTDKSAISEHAWNSHCPIKWAEASVLDHAKNSSDLMIKEAIHIQTTPMDGLINRDQGAEIPGCWVATINAHAQRKAKPSGV